MPSPLQIPKTFTADGALKSELERTTHEIDRYLRDAAATAQQVQMGARTNSGPIAFGFVTRVSLNDGDSLSLQLPRPDPANIGKRCGVRRDSAAGEVLIYAVDCLVAGAERYRMANDIHFVEFLFDGDYFPSRAGAGT